MQNLERILSSISDAVWSFDLVNNKFIYVNSHLSELFQTPLTEIEESDSFWLRYVHPDDLQYAKTETERTFNGSIEIEYRLLIGNEIKWVADKRVILYDESNKPEVISGILSDITCKKIYESKLTDTHKTYRYLFINNPNPLWIYDKKTLAFLAINHAAIAKYGYSEQEFLSMTIADIRPKEDVEELIHHVYAVDNTFLNSNRYWRHLKKNGEILYVNISGHGITHNGREAEIIMAHDITIEVESKNKIRLAKENLDALINNINEDIWSIDTNYKLISANKSFQKTIKEALGREILMGESIFAPEYGEEDVREWKNYYDKALQGESFTFLVMVNLPGIKPFCTETKLNPIKSRNKIIGVACISNNIQERLEAHERILEQNKKLRDVISLSSHEIRGPVATLLGLISAFNRENPTDPYNEEVMQMITTVTNNLDGVLHQLVDKSYSLREERKPIKGFINGFPHNRSMNE